MSSKEIIYTSTYAAPTLPECSLFQYHFPSAAAQSPVPMWDLSLPAYIDGYTGAALTRGQLKDSALRLTTGLRALGLKRGDVGCIWGLNGFGWLTAWWGLMAAGMVTTPANWAYEPSEIAHQLNDSTSSVIFLDAAVVPKFEASRSLLKRKISNERVLLLCPPSEKPEGCPYKSVFELLGGPAGEPEVFSGDQVHDTVFLCYSSGTTGLPKGVMSTHYNMTSQLEAFNAGGEKLVSGRDKVLGVLPNSHVYGMVIINQRPLRNGVPVVFLPRYEEVAMLRAIAALRITQIFIVPPIMITMVQSKNTQQFDLSCMRTILSAAAPLGDDLAQAFVNKFPQTRITQGYGLTETSPIITTFTSEEDGRGGSVGKLIPTWEARLVQEDGLEAPHGQPGELWVRGPCVMRGYLNNPDATAKTMAPDPKGGQWFKTGDVLTRDSDGWFTVVDRFKELIKYKGFQVPPAELEDMLLQHPRVADVCVIGVYDKSQATELPRAYVVLDGPHDDHAGMEREIVAWLAARVARHKRLGGGVRFLDIIPKTASGKILRRTIRDVAQKEQDELVAQGKGASPKL